MSNTDKLPDNPPNNLNARNRRTGILVLWAVIAMIGLSFASVPLYTLFCKVTGFGGTTMLADKAPDHILDRKVTVRFNTDINADLPWEFKAEKKYVNVNIGQQALITYKAKNWSGQTTGGTAVYNVTPPKAGKYFRKIECFCFQEQVLKAGENVDMPILFFIDPAFADDRDMEDVTTITLSYTFYPLDSAALERAMEAFYNQSGSAKQSPENSKQPASN